MMALISADKWSRKREGVEADGKGGMKGGGKERDAPQNNSSSLYGSLGFDSPFCIHKVNN